MLTDTHCHLFKEYFSDLEKVRRDANDAFKKMNKSQEISDDELKLNEDKVQKLTDKFVNEIDKAIETKTTEIMTV